MSETRRSRGITLPNVWHVLVAVAVVGVGWLLWTAVHDQDSLRIAGTLPGDLGDRIRVIEDLVERGGSSIPELVTLLANGDPKIRRDALYGLGRLGLEAESALPEIARRLSDEDPPVRDCALVAFAKVCVPMEERIAVAGRMLADGDGGVRDSAAKILEGGGPVAIPVVIEQRHAKLPETRAQVIRIVLYLSWDSDDTNGNEVTDALRELMDDADFVVSAAATDACIARGVAGLERPLAPRLAQIQAWLRAGDLPSLESGRQAIFRLGPEAAGALPELQDLIEKIGINEGQRLQPVMWALKSLQSAARPAVPTLLKRIEKQGVAGNESVVETLIEIGAEPEEIVPLLIPLLDRGDPYHFPFWSGALLVRVSPEESRRQVSRMIRKIERNEKSINETALHAICGLGSQAQDAVPLLIRLLEHEDRKVQAYAVETLGKVGPESAPAIPALVSILGRQLADTPPPQTLSKGDELLLRRDVIITLGKIGLAPRAVPALLGILASSKSSSDEAKSWPIWQIEALRVLGRLGDNSPDVLSTLRREIATVQSEPSDFGRLELRLAALQSLLLLTNDGAALGPELVGFLEDASGAVRAQAALAIGHNQLFEADAVERLAEAVSDANPIVATAAALALREIGPAAGATIPALEMLIQINCNQFRNSARRTSYDLYARSAKPKVQANPGAALPELQLFVPPDVSLSSLSVAEAARQALSAIDPAGHSDK